MLSLKYSSEDGLALSFCALIPERFQGFKAPLKLQHRKGASLYL